jgi:hypothetical protein
VGLSRASDAGRGGFTLGDERTAKAVLVSIEQRGKLCFARVYVRDDEGGGRLRVAALRLGSAGFIARAASLVFGGDFSTHAAGNGGRVRVLV